MCVADKGRKVGNDSEVERVREFEGVSKSGRVRWGREGKFEE